MKRPAPAVLLCDLDAFFAAVEVLDRPELAGLPVVVGGDPAGRGVVATCTYEARRYGIRSGMPMAEAVRRCPQAVVLPARKQRYRQAADEVLQIYRRFTPQVEAVSIDEAYLDLGGSDGLAAGRAIRGLVRSQLGLAVTIGVSTNKLLAKIACGLAKPDGLKRIEASTAAETIAPLPATWLPGIGPKTAARLAALNIKTIGDLQQYPQSWFVRHLGRRGQTLHEFAWGRDNRTVGPAGPAQSLGEERTLPTDQRADQLFPLLMKLVQQVGYRLRQSGLRGTTVTIKVRYPDFTTVTRSYTLAAPIDSDADLYRVARHLFSQLLLSDRRDQKQERSAVRRKARNTTSRRSVPYVRLLGVQVAGLTPADKPTQISLWETAAPSDKRALHKVVDGLRRNFGRDAIKWGTALTPPRQKDV